MHHNIYALILAAGKGTRMPSKKPKVLQSILGDTLLSCVYTTLAPLFKERIFTLVGYEKEQVEEELEKISKNAKKMAIEQKEQAGTAHALLTAMPALEEKKAEYVLVVNGDVPLLPQKYISAMIEKKTSYDIIFLTMEIEDIGKYGRIVRNEKKELQAIIEAKDYDIALHGKPTKEINAGVYLISMEFAKKYLPKISNKNISQEYYITDLIALAFENKKKVYAYNVGEDNSLLGANTPLELSISEELLRKKRNTAFLEKGVLLHNPASITLSKDVEIEEGVEIYPYCELYGKTKVEKFSIIKSHCILIDSHVEKECMVESFSHIEKAKVGKKSIIGPYARLRPDTLLEENVRIGNFVEVKKSHLETGVKANHLTYIGDAYIGEQTNIGAGTITCNYDGLKKHTTKIGKNCFIGSNTCFIAPVEIQENVLVGAGSVLTKNVEKNMLTLSRSKQIIKEYTKKK